jgi:heme-degrading monooxygenase HmoA
VVPAAGPPDHRFAADQILTVFRSRRRPEAEAAYRALSREMESKARRMRGFVDFKSFSAEDGEQVSIVTFATAEDQRAWRDELSHQKAQQRGRDELYAEYTIQVALCTRAWAWPHLGEAVPSDPS